MVLGVADEGGGAAVGADDLVLRHLLGRLVVRTLAVHLGLELRQQISRGIPGEDHNQIDRLEKVPLEDPRYRTVDAFALPLVAGLGVLLVSLLLEFLWIRRVP